MCNICDSVREGTHPGFGKTISLIEDRIIKGANPEHFKEALDNLLFTKLEPRDVDVESAWEDDYRGTD